MFLFERTLLLLFGPIWTHVLAKSDSNPDIKKDGMYHMHGLINKSRVIGECVDVTPAINPGYASM